MLSHPIIVSRVNSLLGGLVWGLVIAMGLCLQTDVIAQSENQPIADSAEKDYSQELPRFPPKSPAEALDCFEVLDGYRVELVAAEPLVFDPIAFAYDAQLRLFVVEMRDYSEQATEHLGRIALLSDNDGDGRMDQRSTFVDGLSWPTALWPWKDGVIVAEPPRITWYRDTDGDGRSDRAEDWFSGFGRDNVQGLINSLRWGVDGWVHGATSSSGADVTPLAATATARADAAPTTIPLGRRDFALDPLTQQMRPEAGGGQHGLSFNRWGDKFVTSNSDHLQQVIDLEWWLNAHRGIDSLPATRRSIAEDGPQAEVYRLSPVEPWRIVRTRLRMSGVAPGVVEGGGRAAGYFTGATGTWIMDREAGFGDATYDTALVCDVGSNLVHRKRLIDQGMFWTGQRIDAQTELLRSSDTWFRPVQLGDGPDGSLIIADMYREVIEHPKSLPPMIKRHLDLTSGRDMGRIWRLIPIEPAISGEPTDGSNVAPAELTSSELVQRLSHPVAWQRRMASQLLVERHAIDTQAELLSVARSSNSPESQVLAMHIAARWGVFTPEWARQMLLASNERVLQHAIRLTHTQGLAPELANELTHLASNANSPRVQLELSMLADRLQPQQKDQVLAAVMANSVEPMVRSVVAQLAGDASWKLFERGLGQSTDEFSENQAAWLKLLMPGWSSGWHDSPQLQAWLQKQFAQDQETLGTWTLTLAELSSPAQVAGLLSALPADRQAEFRDRVENVLQQMLDGEIQTPPPWRIVRLLPAPRRADIIGIMLEPNRAEMVQAAAIDTMAWSTDPQLAKLAIQRFGSLTPSLQADCLRALLNREQTARLLVEALEGQAIRANQIPLEIREQAGRTKLADRFAQVLGKVAADRQAVIDRYATSVLQLTTAQNATPAQLELGAASFQRSCATCHRLGEIGHDVGPPLRQLGEKSSQQLLETILDPNREIDPKYASYTLSLVDGQVLTGIIRDESAGQITLQQAGGQQHSVSRSDIDIMKNNGVSLMPVGLEESLTPEQMSALIVYLQQAGRESH